MKVASIHLQNFKRFTDLTIRDIPPTAKLVLVVGPNGSGKSSLFDALLHWYRLHAHANINEDVLYFSKGTGHLFNWQQAVDVTLHDHATPPASGLYVRTAYRNDPDFSVSDVSNLGDPAGGRRLRGRRLIDDDKSVSENYRRLVYQTTTGVYDVRNDAKTVLQLRDEIIGDLRSSMRRVFDGLILNNIIDPLGKGSFFFEKGTAKSYHYKNLSGGEKAAFDLLLDLYIKKGYYPDALYCIDEIDAHLHTSVQGPLVREIVSIVPDASQLWITTHSLGALRAAQLIERDSPGSVCIIDFDGVDADASVTLSPTALNRVTWEKMLAVTIGDLANQVAPDVIVICEGSSTGKRRKDFDAEIYNRILGTSQTDLVFISGGSANEVKAAGDNVRNILSAVLPATKVVSLVDRDDKSDREVADEENEHHIVLGRRNLESYLFADDVLDALASSVNQQDKSPEIWAKKAAALATSKGQGHAHDDLKSAAGLIYNDLKLVLNLEAPGNNKDSFMRDTLAPLIQPGMSTYDELHSCIIGKIEGVSLR